ncbi:MAG: hypothetical protein HY717_09465 [Planctomycetes bacterium]|nr:hypothetical protein [Planctomycetota bacterium]
MMRTSISPIPSASSTSSFSGPRGWFARKPPMPTTMAASTSPTPFTFSTTSSKGAPSCPSPTPIPESIPPATTCPATNKTGNSTATLVKSISEDVEIGGGPANATAFGLKPFVERRVASILGQLEGKSKGKALRGRAPGERRRPERPPRGNPIKDWDGDGDGKVSRQEWRGPVGEFDRLDRNGDGYLEAKELRRP